MKIENIVHIDKVSKKFGTTIAIEQLSLEIKQLIWSSLSLLTWSKNLKILMKCAWLL